MRKLAIFCATAFVISLGASAVQAGCSGSDHKQQSAKAAQSSPTKTAAGQQADKPKS